jgi:hypothetical protein
LASAQGTSLFTGKLNEKAEQQEDAIYPFILRPMA